MISRLHIPNTNPFIRALLISAMNTSIAHLLKLNWNYSKLIAVIIILLISTTKTTKFTLREPTSKQISQKIS